MVNHILNFVFLNDLTVMFFKRKKLNVPRQVIARVPTLIVGREPVSVVKSKIFPTFTPHLIFYSSPPSDTAKNATRGGSVAEPRDRMLIQKI